PGSGFFIFLEASARITFRGAIPDPVLPLPLRAGPNLVSAQRPARAGYTNVVGVPPNDGTLVYRHRPGAPPLPIAPENYFTRIFINGGWNGPEPVAEVGEAFFVDAFEPIHLLFQPASQIGVAPGNTVTFEVGASGTGPLRYQWRKNGVNLPGQTNSI